MKDIPEIVKKMTTDETLERGNKLFQKGAVLDIRPNTQGAQVRLISRPGKFESVALRVKFETLSASCSCGVTMSGTLCDHGVAAVLAYKKNFPERFDYCFSEPSGIEGGETVWSGQKPPQQDTTRSVLKKKKLTDIVRNFSTFRANVRLSIQRPPEGDSRWHQLSIKAEIHFEGKIFASSNIRRILDLGEAAGGIVLKDFPPQDQMIMRYLNTYADRKGNAYKMNAHVLSGFLHCLTGFNRFFSGDDQIRISSQFVRLALIVTQKDKGCEVLPALKIGESGSLDLKKCSLLAGTSGFWIKHNLEYFWLPGVADIQWISGFLEGETLYLTQEEFLELRYASDEKTIPVDLQIDTLSSQLIKQECIPIMNLDWNNGVIQARIFFEYGKFTSIKSSSESVWNGDIFVLRDKAKEEEAYEWLTENKYEQVQGSENYFYLDDFDAISSFLLKILPELSQTWKIYYSENFSLCARHIRPVKMKVSTKKENQNWVELGIDFYENEEKLSEWRKIFEAVKKNRELVQLKNGQLVKIDEETFSTIKNLPDLDSLNKGVFKFSRYMSIMMNSLLGGFLEEDSSEWKSLQHKLLNAKKAPEKIGKQLAETLRPYQKDGVAWLQTMKELGLNCVLADEMGLGKTIQALALSSADKKNGVENPSLVICPTSLIQNWFNEAHKFTPELKVFIASGPNRKFDPKELKEYDLIITSYALIRRDIAHYQELEFDKIILDEAQNIKNHLSQTAQACRALNARFKLVLSGTPVENSVKEVWSLFDFILPGLLGSLNEFKSKFSQPDENSAKPNAPAKELAGRIKPFIMRRLKKDLLKQLPPKQEQIINFDLNEEQKILYAAVAGQAGTMLESNPNNLSKERFAVLAILMKLRQICCDPSILEEVKMAEEQPGSAKLDLLKELVYEICDSSHRVLIFSQFTSMLKIIATWLTSEEIKFEYLDGASKNRQQKVDRFNEDESIPVFLLSLKAGGTGLNLTGADTVIHYDMWWNPQVEDQATDRTHRIGQTKSVNVIKLVANNTIEEKVLELQTQKRKLFADLMDGVPQKLGDLTEDDLKFLLS